MGRWAGQTVACIASGPSLTPEDCETIRQAGIPTIVTNTTWKLAPWADVLFAFDSKWWTEYHAEVAAGFRGERVTCCPGRRFDGVQSLHGLDWYRHFNNSGAGAVALAIVAGARRVVMLGYDCQKTGGRTHWHSDHPRPLGNARSLDRWPLHFKNVARFAKEKRVEVINASRQTALKHFERADLADALAEACVA
jgi:hypothetical protein